jgi:3-oxoacyl-[acyl-carrier-protein] synthase II
MSRRVVVTGIGLITPLGLKTGVSWQALINGKSGISTLTKLNPDDFKVKIAGEVKGFNPEDFIHIKEIKKMDTFIQYAIAAGLEAIEDSGIKIDEENSHRIGCITGTGLGGLTEIEKAKLKHAENGRISPFFIPMVIGNLAPGHLAIRHNLKGPNLSIATACASGIHAIGESYRHIKNNICDAMVTGGTESTISPLTFNGFNAMKAISNRNEEPEKASRPFDKDRSGFVIAEGAGIIVLEEYESAKKRGAKIYAEIAGYGASCDAHHITTPEPHGAALSMKNAINEASMNIEDFKYINAHGTSTYYNDINETKAIISVFGDLSKKLMVSSNKSMIGHCLGASGGIEAAFTALTIAKSIVPPTINLDEPDPECTLDYVPFTSREENVPAALCNSFGFGGTNGTLAFKKI